MFGSLAKHYQHDIKRFRDYGVSAMGGWDSKVRQTGVFPQGWFRPDQLKEQAMRAYPVKPVY